MIAKTEIFASKMILAIYVCKTNQKYIVSNITLNIPRRQIILPSVKDLYKLM